MAIGAGLATGIGLGALDYFGGQRQAKEMGRESRRSREFWQNQLRRRRQSPYAAGLKSMFEQSQADLQRLPGYLKRSREGKMRSFAQERMSRFERDLARSGATRASGVGMAGETGIQDALLRTGQDMELGELGALQGMRGQQVNIGRSLMDALYPSPGQSAGSMNFGGAYYDPMSAIRSGLGGFALGDELSQGRNTGFSQGPEGLTSRRTGAQYFVPEYQARQYD